MRPWTPSQSESLDYKEKYGPESVVFGYGTGRENEAVIYRIANILGSPNVLTAGHFCYGPRISTGIITCGTNPIVDYENFPKCIMVWGNNVTISNADEYKGEPFSVALDQGAKLIVVDPRLTRPAARANVWLQLRPGTDAALALGMLNVIVNEGALRQRIRRELYLRVGTLRQEGKRVSAGKSGRDYLGPQREDQGGGKALCNDKTGCHSVGCGHRAADQLCRQ